jgi:hypothetical protein
MNIANINAEIRTLVDADTTSLTDAVLLRRVNDSYEEIVGKLIVQTAGGKWHFGDSNFTALPTGLFTLVNSQEGYQLTGDGTTGINTTTPLLTFLGASVKTAAGLWSVLQPITLWELLASGTDPVEYFKTDGMPQYYEKREDFLILYPAPDNGVLVTLASGLKVFFQRTAAIFTAAEVTTGTKAPGFASPYHMLLVYKAALPYAVSYKPARVPFFVSEITRLEKDLLEFYSRRGTDERTTMKTKPISFH